MHNLQFLHLLVLITIFFSSGLKIIALGSGQAKIHNLHPLHFSLSTPAAKYISSFLPFLINIPLPVRNINFAIWLNKISNGVYLLTCLSNNFHIFFYQLGYISKFTLHSVIKSGGGCRSHEFLFAKPFF